MPYTTAAIVGFQVVSGMMGASSRRRAARRQAEAARSQAEMNYHISSMQAMFDAQSVMQQARQIPLALRRTDIDVQRMGLAAGEAAFVGPLERYQLRRRAKEDETTRRDMLAKAMGTQRAFNAASGIVGGRTTRLAAAQSRNAFWRDQSLANMERNMALTASERREQVAMSQFDFGIQETGLAMQEARLSFENAQRSYDRHFESVGWARQAADVQSSNAAATARQAERQFTVDIMGTAANAASSYYMLENT